MNAADFWHRYRLTTLDSARGLCPKSLKCPGKAFCPTGACSVTVLRPNRAGVFGDQCAEQANTGLSKLSLTFVVILSNSFTEKQLKIKHEAKASLNYERRTSSFLKVSFAETAPLSDNV